MGSIQTFFAFVAVISMILGVIFIFIDGMLLYSIVFLGLGFFLMLMKVMWGISVWTDSVTRKMGKD
ncbi:MAG: hypothetical protein HOD60_12535 [Candidatus Nitrosopelagicus sp.]|jgi:hypothetical protein|nr:hypothetical protein [Candidatus Nitrosopelagicus sp.]